MTKKKIVIYFLSLGVLISCSKEDVQDLTENVSYEAATTVLNVQTRSQKDFPDFEVVDGCLKFQTSEDYLLAFNLLTGKSKRDLLAWPEVNGYTSLLNSYVTGDSIFMSTFIPSRDYEPGESPIDKSERMVNLQLSTLFNNEGMVIINDTILKVRGIYVYVIEHEDFEKVNEVENATDIAFLDYIPHYKHTIAAQSMQRRNYSRTPVINVSSSRREFVEFHFDFSLLFPVVNPNVPAPCYFQAYMKGQAQTKSLGIWWPNFDDEIYEGAVMVNSVNGKRMNFPLLYDRNKVNIYGPIVYNLTSPFTYSISVTNKVQKNKNYPSGTYTSTVSARL